MKNILCYGDSNTWGFIPGEGKRYDVGIRWTSILQEKLGNAYKVIEEGCNGRTTKWDDPMFAYRNGKEYLYPCLMSQNPLDLVIIMLGTNDLKERFNAGANMIAEAVEELVQIAKENGSDHQGNAPEVLVISPIWLDEGIDDGVFNHHSLEKSKRLADYYKEVAIRYQCYFLDAAKVAKPSQVDKVHLDEEGHRSLGEAVSEKVKEILK